MKKWILPSILFLAFILRVVGISYYPVGFTPDEASFGYDAYSILKTGKDQWGNSFPLVLKSFGDYKAPLYAYLTIPSVFLFGLNEFAVRLPNAIVGTLAIVAVYYLVKELFRNSKNRYLKYASVVVSLILAISPWHIMMSRGAFEANLITLFLPLGIYLYLKEKYVLSSLILGLNFFTYHSAKLITPIIFLMLMVLFRPTKKVIGGVAIFLAFFLLTIYTFYLGAGARAVERSITQGALEEGAKTKIELINNGMNPIVARLLHNKYQVTAKRFVENYSQYFSPRFLVFKGPAETTYGMMKNFGVLSYVEVVGIVVGLVFVVKTKDISRSVKLFVLGWLLLAPLPAALSTGVGYAGNRAISMIPVVQIIATLGLLKLVSLRNYFRIPVSLLLIAGFGIFLYKYIVKSPAELSAGMLAGNIDKAQTLIESSNKYDEIEVSKKMSEPHIYIAFASKYDPKSYQEAAKSWEFEKMGINWVDQMPEYRLGKFIFR